MYSKASICKVCSKRVLDEQLDMSFGGLPDQCIYCLLELLLEELKQNKGKEKDLLAALEFSNHFHKELEILYEAAIRDNEAKSHEIHALREELSVLRSRLKFKTDLNDLLE